MTTMTTHPTHRERELAAIISAYNEVTERLKVSHENLGREVQKLRIDLAEKNKELARRERLSALGEMATGLAHEIRNPLGGIQLNASLLDRDLRDLPAAQALVRKISSGVEALDEIVGDILDFGGQRPPDIVPVSCDELVSKVFDTAAAQALLKAAALVKDGSLDTIEVWVDRLQMERALLNVVRNGIEAVESGGCVSVSAAPSEDGLAALVVTDDGPGVSATVMDKIFNPFFTTKETGTGLGLAIVHSTLESHGGRVRVCNRPDGGAEFTLYLPTRQRRWIIDSSKGAA